MTRNEFLLAVLHHLRYRGYYWILPEVDYGWKADFIGFYGSNIIEVETKNSWSDYKKDALKSDEWIRIKMLRQLVKKHKPKSYHYYYPKVPAVTKYEFLQGSYPCVWKPNYFVYAAPFELAERIAADPLRPKCFGVWGVRDKDYGCNVWNLSPMRKLYTAHSEHIDALFRTMCKRLLYLETDRLMSRVANAISEDTRRGL